MNTPSGSSSAVYSCPWYSSRCAERTRSFGWSSDAMPWSLGRGTQTGPATPCADTTPQVIVREGPRTVKARPPGVFREGPRFRERGGRRAVTGSAAAARGDADEGERPRRRGRLLNGLGELHDRDLQILRHEQLRRMPSTRRMTLKQTPFQMASTDRAAWARRRPRREALGTVRIVRNPHARGGLVASPRLATVMPSGRRTRVGLASRDALFEGRTTYEAVGSP